MKRITFATPEALLVHCVQEEVRLVVEYQDEQNKQQQLTLVGDGLAQIEQLFTFSNVMAYYRKDGIFYEVVAAWNK